MSYGWMDGWWGWLTGGCRFMAASKVLGEETVGGAGGKGKGR